MTHAPLEGIDDRELDTPPYQIDPAVLKARAERDAFRLAADRIADEHRRSGALVTRERMRWIGQTCAEFCGLAAADVPGVVAELEGRADVQAHVEAAA